MQEDPLPAKPSSGPAVAPRRGQALTVIFALVAIVAVAAAVYFWRGQQSAAGKLAAAQAEETRAKQNFRASKDAIDAVVVELADNLGNSAGIKPEAIASILAKVTSAIDTLETKTENNPDVRRSQAVMYVQFSATYLALGNSKLAVDSAKKGTDIFRALAAAQPNNNNLQSDVGLSLEKLGAALRASGDGNGALAADRESLQIARTLADKEPGNKQFRTDVVLALWRLAAVGDDPRERLTEALAMLKDLKLAALLTPDQERWIATIEGNLAKLR
jgi:hypothetical protein